jgi:hypothetical protein
MHVYAYVYIALAWIAAAPTGPLHALPHAAMPALAWIAEAPGSLPRLP